MLITLPCFKLPFDVSLRKGKDITNHYARNINVAVVHRKVWEMVTRSLRLIAVAAPLPHRPSSMPPPANCQRARPAS